ncbi:MAG: zinc ribbon domain-containing protein [Gemmatimonadales bacterium]
MTDLERLAAALLAQWRTEGGPVDGPIAVGSILDRTMPYRVARRLLGIDVSEDYEALLLRLVAEEEGLVVVEPSDAAEMARTTMAARIPDLDVLQLLRSATVTFQPGKRDAPRRRPPAPAAGTDRAVAVGPARGPAVPEPAVETPVIPIRAEVVADHTAVAPPPAPAGPAPAFVTQVRFDAPGAACWSCDAALPTSRTVKFCPFCGADQREPTCPACNVAVERGWKHCPDCGERLPTT